MKSWYRIEDKGEDATDVYLYDEIGYWGVTAKEFIRDLNKVKTSVINLFINSPGGDVFDGFAIYENLQRHPATINVVVDGIAASAASYIAQAGDSRVMSKTASMMIHDAWGFGVGPADDLRKLADTLDQMSNTIAGIYAGRAGGSAEEWRARMTEETWYNAEDAVSSGLADEVDAPPPSSARNFAPRFFNLSKFKNVPDWVRQAPIEDAGRTMSQGNLDQLHNAIGAVQAVHDATCDMGADCPVETSIETTNRGLSHVRNDLGQCVVPGCDDMASAQAAVCSDHMAGLMALPGDGEAEEPGEPIYMQILRRMQDARDGDDFACSFTRTLEEATA